jgi:hypothetical protein
MRKVKRELTFEEIHASNLYCTDDAWVMSNLYSADAWVRSPSKFRPPSVTMNKDVVRAKNRLKKTHAHEQT